MPNITERTLFSGNAALYDLHCQGFGVLRVDERCVYGKGCLTLLQPTFGIAATKATGRRKPSPILYLFQRNNYHSYIAFVETSRRQAALKNTEKLNRVLPPIEIDKIAGASPHYTVHNQSNKPM